MEQILLEELLLLLDNLEIESSVNIKKNNKNIKIIDHRIICDKKTSTTYLAFKTPDENEYTKINLHNIFEFIFDGLISALPGENIDKLNFVTSYLNNIPKLNNPPKMNDIKMDIAPSVKEIIISNIDIIDKLKQLINIEDGKIFIKKMSQEYFNIDNSDDEKIIKSLDKLLTTSLGQKCIRRMASKYIDKIEEQIKMLQDE